MRIIDSISDWTGKLISWLCVVLVMVLVLEVVMRYAFNAPQVWSPELSAMLGGTIVAMGWAYTHRHNNHVRVDVIYNYLPSRGRAIVNVICAITMFFPLMYVLIHAAASWAYFAWIRHEVLTASHWYPPAAPSRTMVLVALLLFALQGISQFIRDFRVVVKAGSNQSGT